jgi:DNA-binding response OmpR family regulator
MGAKNYASRPYTAMLETQVLVVEDDAATAAFLADNLTADGYRVAVASGAGEGVRAIAVRRPDIVLLDVVLDDGNGLRLLDEVRSADGLASRLDRELPVIVVSGRGSEVERVRGFQRGADDFLVKPFSYPELVARMQALLRRATGRRLRGVVRVGDLEIDPVERRVTVGGRVVDLTKREYDLLRALAVEPTRVCPKGELLRDVWGYAADGATRTVDAHASRLRQKLAGGDRPFVLNVRGVGWKLVSGS